MGIEVFNNTVGFANFVLAVNHESSGFLLTGLLFAFFIIVCLTMLKINSNSLWETMAVAGFSSFIPSLLATTLYFQSIQAVKFWVVLLFGIIMTIGLTGMYFNKKT